MILITLHLDKILNLGGDCLPQEENEASKVQHLTGNHFLVRLAKLSVKVPFIKDKEFIVDCCLGNAMLVARL